MVGLSVERERVDENDFGDGDRTSGGKFEGDEGAEVPAEEEDFGEFEVFGEGDEILDEVVDFF